MCVPSFRFILLFAEADSYLSARESVRTPLGQILSIPRRLLDPRRPLSKLSKEDQEESLLPYDSLLPIDSRGVLSRDEEVRPFLDTLYSSRYV